MRFSLFKLFWWTTVVAMSLGSGYWAVTLMTWRDIQAPPIYKLIFVPYCALFHYFMVRLLWVMAKEFYSDTCLRKKS
jgi:hypothetical protein